MTAWNPQQYQSKCSFVWQYGEGLLELLKPQPGERILDIGCGTGQLTAEIARSGATAVGLDNSPEMLAQARSNFPQLTFEQGDATKFRFAEPFDAVFSNAALHWVKNKSALAACIAQTLRPGGRFLAECGGKGCIASVVSALRAVLDPSADQLCPWYFASIGEFAPLVEEQGLEVTQALLFDRPTRVEGESAMEEWLRMFCGAYFRGLSDEETGAVIARVSAQLRPALFHDGVWTLDYRRLRIVAHKPLSFSIQG